MSRFGGTVPCRIVVEDPSSDMGDQGRAGPDINGVGYSPPVVTVIGPGGRDVQNPTCILGLATSRRSIERNWERKGRFVL